VIYSRKIMPIDVRHFLADNDISGLNIEQIGAFFMLLCSAWQRDPPCCLPNKDEALENISRLYTRWRRHGPAIKALFQVVDDKYLRNPKQWQLFCRINSAQRTRLSHLREALLQKWGHRCFYCGDDDAALVLHIEHMTSLARGGSDDFENLTLACEECNLTKGRMTADEFLASPKRAAIVLRKTTIQRSHIQ
jgi:5-methylcytosine-specific restriction endonuclease McrA